MIGASSGGYDGKDGEAVLSPGDVISVPIGTFRAFESVGSDDNFMLSFLGEDDPGCVTWANDVTEGAADFGFYLRHDSSLVDVNAGDEMPDKYELMRSLSEAELLKFNHTSPAEMLERVYNVEKFPGYSDALRDVTLPGGSKAYHALIGEGCHELGEIKAHILDPHSFSLGAIVAEPNNGFLRHKYAVKQVRAVGAGQWQVSMGEEGAEEIFEVGVEDTISVPTGVYRSMRKFGKEVGVLCIASAGDLRAEFNWAPEVVAELR